MRDRSSIGSSSNPLTVRNKRWAHAACATALLPLLLASPGHAQSHASWQQYGGASDEAQYSALKQINRANVKQLTVAWTYPTGDGNNYRFNPIMVDGQVYVAGLKGWQPTAAKDACFQRVRYTGKPVRMPTSLHVKKDAIEIGFTVPIDSATAGDRDSYDIEQWNYVWSSNYGSDEYSVAEPKTKAHDPVDVESVTLSADKKTVFLKLDGVEPVMQMKIQMKLKSADGSPMDYSIYNTINQVPKSTGKPAATTASVLAH